MLHALKNVLWTGRGGYSRGGILFAGISNSIKLGNFFIKGSYNFFIKRDTQDITLQSVVDIFNSMPKNAVFTPFEYLGWSVGRVSLIALEGLGSGFLNVLKENHPKQVEFFLPLLPGNSPLALPRPEDHQESQNFSNQDRTALSHFFLNCLGVFSNKTNEIRGNANDLVGAIQNATRELFLSFELPLEWFSSNNTKSQDSSKNVPMISLNEWIQKATKSSAMMGTGTFLGTVAATAFFFKAYEIYRGNSIYRKDREKKIWNLKIVSLLVSGVALTVLSGLAADKAMQP